MERKLLLKGAEAIGEAAIRSGCTRFYGYPVPNQSDLMEYLVRKEGEGELVSVFQAEDPRAAFFMAYGAAIGGARVLTAVNSIDVADALYAASYFYAMEIPVVCVVFTQSGPGSGNIYPEQSDVLAVLYGNRRGDAFVPVYTPSLSTDCAALTHTAFEVAERYRMPVFLLVDAACAQLTETVDFGAMRWREIPSDRPIVLDKKEKGFRRFTTLALKIEEMEEKKAVYREKREAFFEREKGKYKVVGEENENLVVAYGIGAVQAQRALNELKAGGIPLTVFELSSLNPFPAEAFRMAAEKAKNLFILELSEGQLREILMSYLPDSGSGRLLSKTGGFVPRVEEIVHWIQSEVKTI